MKPKGKGEKEGRREDYISMNALKIKTMIYALLKE